MPFRVIAPAAPKAGFRVIKPAVSPDEAQGRESGDVMGATQTFDAAVPLLDEFKAGASAAIDTVQGKGKFGDNWRRQRDFQEGARTRFAEKHPIGANAAKGLAYDVQALPMFLSGGASSALPALAEEVGKRGLMATSRRIATAAGRNAVIGGGYAAANAAADKGTAGERLDAAGRAIPAGAALGVAIPATVAGAGKARRAIADASRGPMRTAARLANRATGGKVLVPQQEAMKRLGEAMKADGLGPAEVRAGLAEWQRTGASSPALLDLAGENTRALIRSAASKPGAGRNTAVQYADRTAADLQDNAIERTRALTPDRRTIPELEAGVDQRITAASALDEVPAGSGGAGVSRVLNDRYDTARQGVDAAYGAARGAAPESAHLPDSEFPQLRANVREAVRDFHPEDVPSVARELDGLDKMSNPTVRDLYEVRQRLTGVRMSKPEQARAAAQAIRAIDGEISGAVERGAVTGDPEVVQLWRNAIGARREMGRQFEGDDLVQKLTERDVHGEGRTQAVAPEDASNVILGRNGVSARPDLTRDLVRLRDMLGADSPEWSAFQRESTGRLLGKDAGGENFGASWDTFARQNPELADVLMSAEQRTAVEGSRRQIGEAVADRGAMQTGRSVLNASPDQLATEAAGLGDRQPLAQVGAARQIEDQIGRPTEGATGLLNTLATGTNKGRNLSAIFGDEEAANYQDAIRREIERLSNARFVDPNSGYQGAARLADDLVQMPGLGKAAIARALFDKLRRGVSLTQEERAALVDLGTTIVRGEGDIPAFPTTPQAMRLLNPAQRQRISGAIAAFEGAREGNRPKELVP